MLRIERIMEYASLTEEDVVIFNQNVEVGVRHLTHFVGL